MLIVTYNSTFLRAIYHLYICTYYSYIMKTCPCNVDPLTPHFYIKFGFTGVYIFFIFLL